MEEKIRLAVFGQKRLSREGGIEIVVKELCTRMAQNGCDVTCYNRAGHHVSGAEYDKTIEYDGIRQKVVPTIEKKGLAAVSSSFFAALCSAFGRYDVVHIHAEGPAFFCWIPKLFGKRVISTIHGLDWDREKWRGSVASKFIRGGEKNAVKYADEIILPFRFPAFSHPAAAVPNTLLRSHPFWMVTANRPDTEIRGCTNP